MTFYHINSHHRRLLREQMMNRQRNMANWEKERLEQLHTLTAGLAKRADIRIALGGNWAWSAAKRTVLVPLADLDDLERCRAITAHEVGHVLFTRHMAQLPIPLEEGIFPDAFLHNMINVFEDPRVEIGVSTCYPGAKIWLQDLHKREEVVAQGMDQSYLPLALQFFQAHLREYHNNWQRLDDIRETMPAIIWDILEKTREQRIAISTILPNTMPTDILELEQAFQEEVLPRLPEMDSMHIQDQHVYLAMARMLSKLEKEIRGYCLELYRMDEENIEEALQELFGKGGITEQTNQFSAEEKRAVYSLAFSKNQKNSKNNAGTSKVAQDLLREFYEKSKKYQECTETIFQQMQRNGRRRGGDPNDDTQDLERSYQELKKGIYPQIQRLTQELENLLRPTHRGDWQDGYTSGPKVNIRKMLQQEARNQVMHTDPKIDFWQRKTKITKRSVAATLLVDLSGSMRGEKSIAALQGAILFAEALHALDIPASVAGFKTEVIPVVGFGERFSNVHRRNIAKMLRQVGSINHDALAVEWAYKELTKQSAVEKILIVISDGQPVGPDSPEDLVEIIQQIQDKIHLIGLGLGPQTGHVEEFYRHGIGNIPITDLSKNIGQVLQKVLQRK